MGRFAWQLHGIDEAGYGPRLGPLVQACSRVAVEPADAFDFDDWDQVAARVAAVSSRMLAAADAAGVRVGDSKALYARAGAAGLWRAAGGFGGQAEAQAGVRGDAPAWLVLSEEKQQDTEHPSAGLDFQSLISSEAPVQVAWPGRMTAGAWCLYPGAFNTWALARNKAEINWELTRRLVASSAGTAGRAMSKGAGNGSAATPTPTVWTLDRQGGRKRYGALLSELFAPAYVRVVEESASLAVYRVQGDAVNAWVAVKVEGEQWSAATGLASMIAKSLREAAMARFNEYFCARYPALRPTAGYPTDAERWRAALLELEPDGRFDWARLWRCK